MVMSLFSVFWLSFGLLQLPSLGLAAAYSATGNALEGSLSKEYNAVIGIYLIVWGFALFTFWILTLKTNTVFALIFLFTTMGAWVLAGAYFHVGSGDYVTAEKLQKVSLHQAFSIALSIADRETDWRSTAIHRGSTGLVYDVRDHGDRDAPRDQLPGGRPQPLLAAY